MIKAYDLRQKSKAELIKQLEELKGELSQLRVAQVTGGAASKLSKIKVIRKGIARVLTVINQMNKAAARESFKGKKFVPKELRPKKTSCIRRELTKQQKAAKTQRVKTREQNFPKRRYALAA